MKTWLQKAQSIAIAALINGVSSAAAFVVVAMKADPELAAYAAAVQGLLGFLVGVANTLRKPTATVVAPQPPAPAEAAATVVSRTPTPRTIVLPEEESRDD